MDRKTFCVMCLIFIFSAIVEYFRKPNINEFFEDSLDITDDELKVVSEALLAEDVNEPSRYVITNIQSKTTSYEYDSAPEPLFTVNPSLWNIPTVAAMKNLFDNYEQDVRYDEYVSWQEKNEEDEFLDAIMATTVMRYLMNFLQKKHIVTSDPSQQKEVLRQSWFDMYSRKGRKISSCGFEHVFLSEIKNNKISGLHNWIYFYLAEAAGYANYLGYLDKIDIDDNRGVLKLNFSMNGIDKPLGSMFVGTSPELEMALYSLCFYTRPDERCEISLNGQVFNLKTHTFYYDDKDMIGSAFPEI